MHGAIRVASDGLNQGATFTLELPVAAVAVAVAADTAEPQERPQRPQPQHQEMVHAQ